MDSNKLWRQYNAFRKRKSVQFAPSIYKALKIQIDYYIRTKDLNNLPVLPMQDALTELYKDVGRIWAANTFYSILKDAKVKYIPPQVIVKRAGAIGLNQQFIDDILEFFRLYILNLTTTITQTTKTQIQDIISKGIENQWSLDEIINELQTTGVTKMRAARIARTEVGRAANYGEQAGTNRTGLETKKIWIAVRDFRTREHHKEVDDQVRLDGKPFDVDGYLMQRPGDQNSEDGRRVPASLIVNCRCCVGREVIRDKNGLPLRRTGGNMPPSIPLPIQPETPPKPVFRPAATIEEAKQWAIDNLGIKKHTSDLNVDALNTIHKRLFELKEVYNTPRLKFIEKHTSSAYASANAFEMSFSKEFDNPEKLMKGVNYSVKYGWLNNGMTKPEALIDHEFGHVLTVDAIWGRYDLADELSKLKAEYTRTLTKLKKQGKLVEQTPEFISTYAQSKIEEFAAEGFAMALNSKNPSPFAIRIKELIDKYYKK